MVSEAYEHLARLSIFVEVARLGELTASHDAHRRHFERLLHRLGADANGGLYTVMCGLSELNRMIVDHEFDGQLIGVETANELRSIRIQRPRNHALRHIRDYTVATTAHRVAQRLVVDLQRLVDRQFH